MGGQYDPEYPARMVKVYSNATEAELFVNGISQGVKKRSSQDYPAAGLRWMVKYQEVENTIKVVAKRGKETVIDEIKQQYQTKKWSMPLKLVLQKIADEHGKITVEAKAYDVNNVLCLDAKDTIEFGLTGDGELIDNQGTSSGSRKVQIYNGRATISLNTNAGKSIISVKSQGLPTAFLVL